MVRFGINGFGRIGRLVLRAANLRKTKDKTCFSGTPEIVAINDPAMSAEQMAYLIKYDSTHGLFPCDITPIENSLKIGGQVIEVLNESDPCKIPWAKNCIKYVVESSGKFIDGEKARGHIRGSVKRVLIAANSPDVPTFIIGVNHECFNTKQPVISLGSPTTNCLAPILKIVNDQLEIQECLMTTIQAVRVPQTIVDTARKPQWCVGRGAFQNIIPRNTVEGKIINRIIPNLEGRINGIAVSVPIADTSMIDLNIRLCQEIGYEAVCCKIKEASTSYMKGIIEYTDDHIVSSDVRGNSHSAVFCSTAGLGLNKTFIKLIAFYDNEWAFANRIVDMVNYIGSREDCNEKE